MSDDSYLLSRYLNDIESYEQRVEAWEQEYGIDIHDAIATWEEFDSYTEEQAEEVLGEEWEKIIKEAEEIAASAKECLYSV